MAMIYKKGMFAYFAGHFIRDKIQAVLILSTQLGKTGEFK